VCLSSSSLPSVCQCFLYKQSQYQKVQSCAYLAAVCRQYARVSCINSLSISRYSRVPIKQQFAVSMPVFPVHTVSVSVGTVVCLSSSSLPSVCQCFLYKQSQYQKVQSCDYLAAVCRQYARVSCTNSLSFSRYSRVPTANVRQCNSFLPVFPVHTVSVSEVQLCAYQAAVCRQYARVSCTNSLSIRRYSRVPI